MDGWLIIAVVYQRVINDANGDPSLRSADLTATVRSRRCRQLRGYSISVHFDVCLEARRIYVTGNFQSIHTSLTSQELPNSPPTCRLALLGLIRSGGLVFSFVVVAELPNLGSSTQDIGL